jgi:chromatin remodeling complex protein RSC6
MYEFFSKLEFILCVCVKIWTYIIFKHQGQCQNDNENVKMWGKIGTMIGIKKYSWNPMWWWEQCYDYKTFVPHLVPQCTCHPSNHVNYSFALIVKLK